MKKIFFFLIDGLADKGKETALRKAKKRFIDSILDRSFLSYIYPLPKEYWPKYGEVSVSGLANLSLLGYKISPEKFKRGVYEAIGSKIKFKNGWLAARINFATVDENLKVVDRRAGRNTYGLDILVAELNKKIKIRVPFKIYHTLGHRGVLIIKSKLSDKISENDPFDIGKKIKKIKPLDNSHLTKKTAEILNNFLEQAYQILKNHPINLERQKMYLLPANYLLFREPGNKILKLKNFFEKYEFKNGCVLATNGVDKGTCLAVGFKEFTLREAQDIDEEMRVIYQTLQAIVKKNYQIIYIHLKKADEAAHDKNFEKKKYFFEKFDLLLQNVFTANPNEIFVITGDHITSVLTGKHQFGPVPLLIINSSIKNNPKEFSESEALKLGNYFKENSQIWQFLRKNVN
jgi:2,3-bisphosphoglycerate-independent phosphoglycerate mutase